MLIYENERIQNEDDDEDYENESEDEQIKFFKNEYYIFHNQFQFKFFIINFKIKKQILVFEK